MFPSTDGSLTLMYVATLMVLLRFHDSLTTMENLTCDVAIVINGRRCPECSFNLYPQVLADSPIYSSSHITLQPVTFLLVDYSNFCVRVSLSLGVSDGVFLL